MQTESQNLGGPVTQETHRYDPQGQELLEGGSGSGNRRIEDVTVEDVTDTDKETDADKLYRERMEDEYAKREGGA